MTFSWSRSSPEAAIDVFGFQPARACRAFTNDAYIPSMCLHEVNQKAVGQSSQVHETRLD